MYRRDISHLLKLLGSGLILLTGFHLLFKPSPEEFAQTTDSSSTGSVEQIVLPPPAYTSPAIENAQVRSLDLPTIPHSPHEAVLAAIRDDIDAHRLPLAESKLRALPTDALSDTTTKHYTAILWNNLGIEQERIEGTAVSIKAFKQAAALDDSNPVILLNLAHTYWEQRDPALNQDLLDKLIRLVPDEPFPHLALAELLQEQDQLAEAAKHLSQAADRARQDPGLQSHLASVAAKVHRAETAESRMTARSSAHFTVKFDGAEDHGTWTTVLDVLEEAYREIGQTFGHFPSKPIVVVLHTGDSFQHATDSPAWADGLYDPALGRIQLPTQGATTDTQRLATVLRHEYVHALLHDRLGMSGGSLPTWLNEGLAMQLAGGSWPDLDQALQGETALIPLTYLEGPWGSLPTDTARLAYLEANSATRYLIERWGMAQVDELLKEFKARTSVATAIQNKLFVSYEQFHQQWLQSFDQKRS